MILVFFLIVVPQALENHLDELQIDNDNLTCPVYEEKWVHLESHSDCCSELYQAGFENEKPFSGSNSPWNEFVDFCVDILQGTSHEWVSYRSLVC